MSAYGRKGDPPRGGGSGWGRTGKSTEDASRLVHLLGEVARDGVERLGSQLEEDDGRCWVRRTFSLLSHPHGWRAAAGRPTLAAVLLTWPPT
jgi:hypothetical protein